jgi:alkanesulfonate monooxygenase SsuD/methylene tetrahydromethanopterin reductase-like flavin-dependent oxidoreductase (luciferase family)
VQAAAAQARALGADPACVFVRHPIQDRTDDELRALADAAVEEILRLLTTG